MKNNSTMAVLMTCHNRQKETLTCLNSLFNNEEVKVDIEVFLVDDGSTDKTSEKVSKNFPKVNIIKGDGSLFWNRGMWTSWNKAAKTSDFDFYLWLNDDTYLNKDGLKQVFETYKRVNTNSIIVGTISSPLDNSVITYGGYDDKGLITPTKEIEKCKIFNGNLVLVPKEVYLKLGNLDFRFRHGIGDFEYGMRAKKESVNSYVTPVSVGVCERNVWPPSYLSNKNSLNKRLKLLYSPLGFNPKESFYLNSKYKNFFYAIFVFVKLHLNVFFPFLVKKNI